MMAVEADPIPESDYAGRKVVRAPLPSVVEGKVVGVSHAPSYPRPLLVIEAAFARRPGRQWAPAVLVREPDNPHDPCAVRFDVPGVGPCGHIPAQVAARLAPELDAGQPWAAATLGVLRHQRGVDQLGLTYKLRRLADWGERDRWWNAGTLGRWLEDVEAVRGEVAERPLMLGAHADEITARYEGFCPACGRLIVPGDRLRRRPKSGAWRHAHCKSPAVLMRPEDPDARVPDRPKEGQP